MAESRERTTSRLQLSGQRFLSRRMQHALVRGDVRMLDDPLRAQSLSLGVGAVLGVLLLAAGAILAVLRPQGDIDGATILAVRDTGALYVRIGDTVHPVPNLTSAQLITGAATTPTEVSADAVAGARRGPGVGIPGAPAAIGIPLDGDTDWTVCDTADRTTVLVGPTAGGPGPAAASAAALVTPTSEPAAVTYLVYDGRRALVDLRDRAVIRALRIDGRTPRPVSRTLLEAVPETAPITAPAIPRAGAPGPAALAGYPVGTVVRMSRADTAEHYVVLSDGVQRIGEVTADLIRSSVTQPDDDIPTVAATALAATPSVDTLTVDTFPARVEVTDAPVLCVRWTSGAGTPHTTLLWGVAVPSAPATIDLAQRDDTGPRVDAFGIPSGRALFARAVGVDGSGGAAGPRHLVTDTGVTFGVGDDRDVEALGLGAAVAAPWPVLRRLPRGPELSGDRASVLRDTVSTPGPG